VGANVTANHTANDTANVAGTPAATVVSTANTANSIASQLPVINGGFDATPTGYGWAADSGTWFTDTTSISPGVQPNCARRNGNSITPTDVYRNSGRMGVDVGQIVRAQGLIKAVGADGNCAVRISWLDANQAEITTTQGNTVTGTTTAGSYVVGTAPANARYARVELIANSNTVGYYLVDNVLVTQYPKNISEVPNGGGHNSVTAIDGNGLALVDFSQTGHVNKTLDYMPDTATRFAAVQANADNTGSNTANDTAHVNGSTAAAISDGAGRAQAGFDTSGYLVTGRNNLDRIGDSATFGRVKGSALYANAPMPFSGGKSVITNSSFASNVVGGSVGGGTTSGPVCDGWQVAAIDAASWLPIYEQSGGTADILMRLAAALSVPASSNYSCYVATYGTLPVSPLDSFSVTINSTAANNVALPAGLSVTSRFYISWLRADGSASTTGAAIGPDITGTSYADTQRTITGTVPSDASSASVTMQAIVTNSTGAAISTPAGLPCDMRFTRANLVIANNLDREVVDGTTYARIYGSELSSGVHKLGVADSGKVLGNQLNAPNSLTLNYGAARTATAVTADSTGAVSINAFSVNMGGTTVPYNAVSNAITGLTVGSTYQIYCHDVGGTGGTKTWLAYLGTSTGLLTLGDDVVLAGQVTIPSSGTSGGGVSGTCVCDDMFIDDSRTAGDARPGDVFDCLDIPTQGMRKFRRRLHSVDYDAVPCVRITTDAGAILECSLTTPFDVLDGRTVYAPDMLGEQVVTDQGIETVARVDAIGIRRVCHIHLGGVSYAAGADPSHRIYSHNALKP